MDSVNGQSARAFLPRLRYVVEVACTLPCGVQWSPLTHGDPRLLDQANDAARSLRAQGYRVRVRPVVVDA